jgi:hypothetical protein
MPKTAAKQRKVERQSRDSESVETWNADVLTHSVTSEDSHTPKREVAVPKTTSPSNWSVVIGTKKSIFCTATSRTHADQIILCLKTAGFPGSNLSALFPDKEIPRDSGRQKSAPKHRRKPSGVLAGTAWWAARRVGFATIGAVDIAGAGSFIVVGPIIAALNGGTIGGLADRLSGIGIPEIEAKRYESKIKEGHILISVHTENLEEIAQAKEIFMKTKAQDICAAGETSLKESSGTEYASRPSEAAHSHTRP